MRVRWDKKVSANFHTKCSIVAKITSKMRFWDWKIKVLGFMSGLYCSIFPKRYNKVFDKRIFSQQCYKVTNVTWCRPLTNNAPQQKFQNSSHLILSTLWELAGPRGKYIYRKSKPQRAESNLNQRWKIRAKTSTVWKFIPQRSYITKIWNPSKSKFDRLKTCEIPLFCSTPLPLHSIFSWQKCMLSL